MKRDMEKRKNVRMENSEGGSERGREGGSEGGREGGRESGREGEREGEREGGREGESGRGGTVTVVKRRGREVRSEMGKWRGELKEEGERGG